ncbi:MAG TPA: phosphoribosylanthranilate isomerase [Candidatus Acidoferrales bacterium]
MTRVKICGVTNPEDAQLACELGADAIGLNFYPESPRCVSPFMARSITRQLPPFVAAVGIFVNWKPEVVVTLSKALGLTAAQLHGDESAEDVAAIAEELRVIKALRLGPGAKLEIFGAYKNVSAFLLDTAETGAYGGSGVKADWEFAQTAAKSQRIFLAGGLTPENVGEAIRSVRPYGVDVASGVESKPGKKDPGKLRVFFEEVARANSQD